MTSSSLPRLWHFTQNVLGVLFRHPVTGTSIVPILPDGRLVLVRRRDNGKWALPGGMVNWGEDITTTVCRELAEETGLTVTKVRRLVGVYSSPARDNRVHSICIVVEVEVDGNMTINDPMEVEEIKAFAPQEVPIGELSHDHDQQFQDYLAGRTILA